MTSDLPASSIRMELAKVERGRSRSFSLSLHHLASSSFRSIADSEGQTPSTFGEGRRREDDELELQWAAIKRLPTFRRLRTSVLDRKVVDVAKLGDSERRVFVDGLLSKIEEDNLRLLQKLRQRLQRQKFFFISFMAPTNNVGCKYQGNKIRILKNISGVLKPARMTLLLGPPECGKTALLQALAGKSEKSLKVKGEISYNGYKLNEFVPQKTSAYIGQYDMHMPEMTVRETLDFSARCQGIGGRADVLKEVGKREKQAGINPEPSIDTYMKAISIGGMKRTLQTDYTLKVLGLDICGDTIVGDTMNRGISGGQKRRLTTGEMIIGPARVLFMDEISTGLDSSTTFQIITCLQQLAHITESTILVSLLQPAPETFNLFDDIILMAEGHIVYHGPRTDVLSFFEHCGFNCPRRKGIADFLQEVVSEKDQAQYWRHKDRTYNFISPSMFARMFKELPMGKTLYEELARPFEKTEFHRSALSFEIYSFKKWELLKACLSREWLLMKRNSFFHVFKSAQLVVLAVITVTVFLRTRMKLDLAHADLFMGSLFYALIRLMVNGIQELAMTVSRLSVFYKQRDILFYSAWAYTIPAAILKIPLSLLDAFLWTAITYYGVGYSPEPQRFFYQFFLLFLLHQVSISMFRLIASVVRNPPVAAICSLFSLFVLFLFGGMAIPQPSLPGWLKWGFWFSPLSYAIIGVSFNEFLAPRWQKVSSLNGTLGQQVLKQHGLDYSDHFYWISIGSLIGFWMVFNIGFTCALSFSKAPSRSRAVVSSKKLSQLDIDREVNCPTPGEQAANKSTIEPKLRVMVLPFEPTTLTFENVGYFVETPKSIPGVPKIKDNYNPATWMLEITSPSLESQLGIDYAIIYKESDQGRTNQELVRELSLPVAGTKEMCFPDCFPQNRWEQFKTCLWKQRLTYWRSPQYNLVRLIFIAASSFLCAALLWQKGKEINDEQDLFNILGTMYVFMQFTGVGNTISVLPFVATERIIVYRERFAGMYSPWSYSFAQVVIEVPYIFLQAVLFGLITYPAIGFYVSFYKVFWYFYTMFCTLLYFNYLGMMLVSLTPTYQVASVLGGFAYSMFNLFAGFLIPGPVSL
ncbi:hypothetical protein NL676_000521 [Syzygium grande]|nr:hypothetical protein NL676_000521 [Syzygium grande]